MWRNPDNVLEALPYIDYLFLDDKELEFIGRGNGIKERVHYLRDCGATNVIVTQGSQGSHLFLGEEYRVKALSPERLVDTTGAGDSYMAGFLKVQELFDDPTQQGEFAAMTATMAIERKGPFSGTVEEVMKRLELVKAL